MYLISSNQIGLSDSKVSPSNHFYYFCYGEVRLKLIKERESELAQAILFENINYFKVNFVVHSATLENRLCPVFHFEI